MTPLDYPLWLRATHFFNFLFLSLLVRSGLEVLSAHPRLYWNDHCTPGSEWLTFTKKHRPTDRLWTASDEESSFPPFIALPGRESLGLGRHWHFLADFAWLLTGLWYIVMLFASPEWHRLIPASWQIVPDAGRAMLSYLTLHIVETPGTYNALQQLTYATVIFLLAPFSIATGIAMSPAVAARFPWYIRIFRGRQAARSLHFLALGAFILFFIGHVALVILHGFRKELAVIVLGETHAPHLTRALTVWLSGLTGIIIIHVLTTICSHRRPRFVQKATQSITDPLRTLIFGHQSSTQHYTRADISPYFWVNGRAPVEETYRAMARDHFAGYVLEVGGLVENTLRLTLADLRAMPRQTQVTKHCCIQGWSGVAEWSGVSLRDIVELCHPRASARFIVFYAFDNKSTSEPHAQGPGYFYGTIRLNLADDPQTILAFDMNGEPLPIDHGAPLRLRVETQLGFTMVKYIRAIEFVESYAHIGKGQGGWREDYQYFSHADAFEAIVPVLRHPRCMNCHSAGDFPRQGNDSHQHTMQVRRGPDGQGMNPVKCSTCHQDHNLVGVHMPPGAPDWHLPPPETPMIWEGLTDGQLCELLKDPKQNGHRSIQQIVEHMSTPLVLGGWNPGDGRSPITMKLSEFLARVREWAAEGAICPVGTSAAESRVP